MKRKLSLLWEIKQLNYKLNTSFLPQKWWKMKKMIQNTSKCVYFLMQIGCEGYLYPLVARHYILGKKFYFLVTWRGARPCRAARALVMVVHYKKRVNTFKLESYTTKPCSRIDIDQWLRKNRRLHDRVALHDNIFEDFESVSLIS